MSPAKHEVLLLSLFSQLGTLLSHGGPGGRSDAQAGASGAYLRGALKIRSANWIQLAEFVVTCEHVVT